MTVAGVNIGNALGAIVGAGGAVIVWMLNGIVQSRKDAADRKAQQATHAGTVATSEAGELWQVAKDMIDSLGERADASDCRVDELSKQVDSLLDANTGLLVKLEASGRLLDEVRKEREALQGEVERLLAANRHLEELNADLTAQVAHLEEMLARHRNKGGSDGS